MSKKEVMNLTLQLLRFEKQQLLSLLRAYTDAFFVRVYLYF